MFTKSNVCDLPFMLFFFESLSDFVCQEHMLQKSSLYTRLVITSSLVTIFFGALVLRPCGLDIYNGDAKVKNCL
jgi:hypothetical protein